MPGKSRERRLKFPADSAEWMVMPFAAVPSAAVPSGPRSIERYLDCRGLHSPMPIIQIAKALAQLPTGATLCVDADDEAFRRELEGWIDVHQEKLLSFHDGLKSQSAVIERASR